MFVCLCSAVNEEQVKDAVQNGYFLVSDIKSKLGIGGECGACLPVIEEIINGLDENTVNQGETQNGLD